MARSNADKHLLDAQTKLKRAEQQVKAQGQKVEAARKHAADLKHYLTEVGVRRAQGEEIEPTVTAEQLVAARTDLDTQTAVFAELRKIYELAEKEVEGSTRALFTDEWNRAATERAKINDRITAATLALKAELEALRAHDRAQRAIAARIDAPTNHRLYTAQENFIAWQLREFVEPAGVLPEGIRRPINEADRMTRRAAEPKKEVVT